MGVSLSTTVLNTADLATSYEFWRELLGATARDAGSVEDFVRDGWAVLLVPGGGRLALQTGVVAPVDRDQPIHLDLAADADRPAEVARAVALGAARVEDWPYPDDADYTVLRDPDGHLFCIVDPPGTTPG